MNRKHAGGARDITARSLLLSGKHWLIMAGKHGKGDHSKVTPGKGQIEDGRAHTPLFLPSRSMAPPPSTNLPLLLFSVSQLGWDMVGSIRGLTAHSCSPASSWVGARHHLEHPTGNATSSCVDDLRHRAASWGSPVAEWSWHLLLFSSVYLIVSGTELQPVATRQQLCPRAVATGCDSVANWQRDPTRSW